MRPSRFLTVSGAIILIMASTASAALASTAATTAVYACGADGTAGITSCAYTMVGPGTFTVPAGVYSADFAVDGASAENALGSEVIARLAVSPGETFLIDVGGANLLADNSGVSVGASVPGFPVFVAVGGGAPATSNYVTTAATAYRLVENTHPGNGEVTVSWALPAPPAPAPPVPAPPVPAPPAISIPGLSINLGALLAGVGGLVAGLLG
jgi:hypothetical protein